MNNVNRSGVVHTKMNGYHDTAAYNMMVESF